MPDMTLNNLQRRLARHALGLPNGRKRSYRNYYQSALRGEEYNAWLGMTERGLAEMRLDGSTAAFKLTRLGAGEALEPGESLCTEDFPPSEVRAAISKASLEENQ